MKDQDAIAINCKQQRGTNLKIGGSSAICWLQTIVKVLVNPELPVYIYIYTRVYILYIYLSLSLDSIYLFHVRTERNKTEPRIPCIRLCQNFWAPDGSRVEPSSGVLDLNHVVKPGFSKLVLLSCLSHGN